MTNKCKKSCKNKCWRKDCKKKCCREPCKDKCWKRKCCKKDCRERCCNKNRECNRDQRGQRDRIIIEAARSIRQVAPDSVAVLGECGILRFVDTDTVKWQVYRESDGLTVVEATAVPNLVTAF